MKGEVPVHAMKAHVGALVCWCEVSFTLRPHYIQEKTPHYPLNADWPQSQYDASEKRKISCRIWSRTTIC
jgi:hypothetical protein